MTKKKITILSIVLVLIISISGCKIYNYYTTDQKFDYKFFEEIPEGYVEYDGETYAGKDYEHYYWYKYNEMPQLCDDYKLVGSNVEMVMNALNPYSNGEIGDVKIVSKDVSENDYYIIRSYDSNANEMKLQNGHYKKHNYELYYFDVETNMLQNVKVIW